MAPATSTARPSRSTAACTWCESRRGSSFNLAVHAQRALEQGDHFRAPCGCRELSPLLDARNQALDPIDVETHIRAEGDRLISEIHVDGARMRERLSVVEDQPMPRSQRPNRDPGAAVERNLLIERDALQPRGGTRQQ